MSDAGHKTLRSNKKFAQFSQNVRDGADITPSCNGCLIEFARSHPEQYRLMFGQRVLDLQQYPALQEIARQSFQVLQDIVERGIAAGVFKSQPAELVANTAWALVHGLATLIMDRLEGVMPAELIRQQIELATTALVEKI